MFTCTICKRPQPTYTKPTRVISESEAVSYPYRRGANKFWNEGRLEPRDDPGGKGFQIVREELACPECVASSRQAGASVLHFP